MTLYNYITFCKGVYYGCISAKNGRIRGEGSD